MSISPLFKKLNLGSQKVIHVLDAPASFEPELAALPNVEVLRKLTAPIHFGIAFVLNQEQLDAASSAMVHAASGDALLWLAYPKLSSKKYRCDFNRDSGWSTLGAGGFEPVRQVAIDLDWSALRFRRAEFIQSMTRETLRAISPLGKARTRTPKIL